MVRLNAYILFILVLIQTTFTFAQNEYDYGDAPYPYPVASNKASTNNNSLVCIGSIVDIDTATQYTGKNDALGDDNDGSDDDDGISYIIPTLSNDTAYELEVTCTNKLNDNNIVLGAWIDFDGSLTFDQDEFALAEVPLNTSSTSTITLKWTATTSLTLVTNGAEKVALRLRIGHKNDIDKGTPDGESEKVGEVEDYMIPIAYDYGDAPNDGESYFFTDAWHPIGQSTYPVHIGSTVDADTATQISADFDALGDDNDGSDDEDGLKKLIPILKTDTTYQLHVTCTNSYSTNNIHLGGWMDFNGNGSFESTEYTSVHVPKEENSEVILEWENGSKPLLESNLETREIASRLRISLKNYINANAHEGFIDWRGEVEDYMIPVASDNDYDYGDAPNISDDDKLNFPEARHKLNDYSLYIGSSVDADDTTQVSSEPYAMGDDNDGIDDEDAIVNQVKISADDKLYQLRVKCTNTKNVTATLGAWLDLNGNGFFEESEYTSSQCTTSTDVILQWGDKDSTSYLLQTQGNFDEIGLRLRIAASDEMDESKYEGDLNSGEVEDYMLTVACSCENGETDNWIFGYETSISFENLIDGYPQSSTEPKDGGKTKTREGCTSISDACGELLLYSDGLNAYGGGHKAIGNDLAGDPSASQSGIIVEYPYRSDLYYVFYNDEGTDQTTYYSVIDLKLNDGFGDIATGTINNNTGTFTLAADSPSELLDIPVKGSPNTNESLAACEKPDYSGYWILCHENNSKNFHIGNIDKDGISWEVQNSDSINGDFKNIPTEAISNMKFSPDGQKLAVAYGTVVYQYDFNPEKGYLSNETQLVSANSANNTITIEGKDINTDNFTAATDYKYLNIDTDPPLTYSSGDSHYFFGIEYSPSGEILYVSALGNSGTGDSKLEPGMIYQISLKNDTAKLTCAFAVDNVYPDFKTSAGEERYYGVSGLQQAKDGRIYFSDPGNTYLGVIDKPEVIGHDCTVIPNKIKLSKDDAGTLPYRGYAQLGLPNFMAGLFYDPSVTTSPDFVLVNDTLEITIKSTSAYVDLIVDFGDGTAIEYVTTETFPYTIKHCYCVPGTSTVTLTYKTNLCSESTSTEVEITNDLIVSTIFADSIYENRGRLHGKMTKGEAIKEYGFTYSQKVSIDSIINLSHVGGDTIKQVKTTLTTGVNYDIIGAFNFDIDNLIPREYCFYRAYMKDKDGVVTEGTLQRFITEKRDFSLALDGGSALAVNTDECKSRVTSWGTNKEFSIDFWIKRDRQDTEEYILSNTLADYSIAFDMNNQLVFTYGNKSLKTTSNTIEDSLWHHVAFTHNNGESHIYINGEPTTINGSLSIDPPDDSNTGNLFIGSDCADNGTLNTFFKGKIDALRFWNTDIQEGTLDSLLSEHVLINGEDSTILLCGEGCKTTSLLGQNLQCLFDFNVMSNLPSAEDSIPDKFHYQSENQFLDYNFFQESSRLNTASDSIHSFIVAVFGNAKPSVDLPWAGWRFNANTKDWLSPDNWSGYCYPGEGIKSSELDLYEDVTTTMIEDSVNFCEYTIIHKTTNDSIPTIRTITPPEINILIDRDDATGSYEVNSTNGSELTIKKGLSRRINDANTANSNGGTIIVSDGSIEAH